jgi:hypothetical protein
MKTLDKKEIKHINNSLAWGDKKVIAIELGILQPALSRYLKPKAIYNIGLKRFEDKYVMPDDVYNAIINYINNK